MPKQNNDIGITKTKICARCKQEKPINQFRRAYCVPCKKELDYLYKINDPIKHKQSHTNYYLNNKNKVLKYQKEYNTKNKDKRLKYNKEKADHVNKYNKEYNKHNRHKINKQRKERKLNDPNYKMDFILRCRLYHALKEQGVKKQTKFIKLIGCTIIFFKQHIEQQFKPEMNWNNHGKIWEIDHMLPCSSFNLIDEEEQLKCFHYSNMQPLFKTTKIAESFGYINEIGNRDKKDKII